MKKLSKLKMRIIILMGAFMSIHVGVTYAEDLYGTFPAVFNLINLNGTNGFAINDINPSDSSGWSVNEVGDVNGDGIADIVIGAPNGGNMSTGRSYVVFGSKKAWAKAINLADLNGSNGFAIIGINPQDDCGNSVSGAGDMNGDGIADIIIGAPRVNNNTGQSYVVFGSKGSWPAAINLTDLNGNNGFTINGINPNDYCGNSVSGAGDVNGDGIDDVLLAAFSANNTIGQSYVVFGSKEAWSKAINLINLNGNNGFAINGIQPMDTSGYSVSGVGDVNGDGIADIIIGAPSANNLRGQSYIVFGSKQAWPAANFNLIDLNGNNGFAINGINPNDNIGWSVSEGGDVNGDGIDDIIIGAKQAGSGTGQSYVVFGNKEPWPAAINLQYINGKNGFAINGINPGDESGNSVNGAGDVNGDGIADIIIGAPTANNGRGQSYVVFGSKKSWPADIYLYILNGTDGFTINGINPNDYSGFSVNGAWDINGDGIDDILIGAPTANNGRGQSYIVFGEK